MLNNKWKASKAKEYCENIFDNEDHPVGSLVYFSKEDGVNGVTKLGNFLAADEKTNPDCKLDLHHSEHITE